MFIQTFPVTIHSYGLKKFRIELSLHLFSSIQLIKIKKHYTFE